MGRIFISYSTKETTVAQKVCEYLEDSGVRCWMAPRDISPGLGSYMAQIVDAVNKCSAMVVLASSISGQSGHVINEVTIGFDDRKPIIPFRLDKEEFSKDFQYLLGTKQWIDASENFSSALYSLKVAVQQIVAPDFGPEPSAFELKPAPLISDSSLEPKPASVPVRDSEPGEKRKLLWRRKRKVQSKDSVIDDVVIDDESKRERKKLKQEKIKTRKEKRKQRKQEKQETRHKKREQRKQEKEKMRQKKREQRKQKKQMSRDQKTVSNFIEVDSTQCCSRNPFVWFCAFRKYEGRRGLTASSIVGMVLRWLGLLGTVALPVWGIIEYSGIYVEEFTAAGAFLLLTIIGCVIQCLTDRRVMPERRKTVFLWLFAPRFYTRGVGLAIFSWLGTLSLYAFYEIFLWIIGCLIDYGELDGMYELLPAILTAVAGFGLQVLCDAIYRKKQSSKVS